MLVIDEPGGDRPRQQIRIRDCDHVLKLPAAVDLSNALDRRHLVRMRRAGSVEESLLVESRRLDDQCIAVPVPDRMTRVVGEDFQVMRRLLRLVHDYDSEDAIELIRERGLARGLNDLERVRIAKDSRDTIGDAKMAGLVPD